MSTLILSICLFVMMSVPGALSEPPAETLQADVIIYGGSFASCAAAVQAAPLLPPGRSILMIVPESRLGSVGTVGGQNFFDIRRWNGEIVTRGSFIKWFNAYGQGYPPEAMARALQTAVTAGNKVKILFNCEIEEVSKSADGRIASLSVRPVMRNPETLKVLWAGRAFTVKGGIFIDGSETGRLARLAGAGHTVGRQDAGGDMHQQAATLMFQVRGINPAAASTYRNAAGQAEFFFYQDVDGSGLGWGGKEFVTRDPVIGAYNSGGHRFRIKGYNVAEDSEKGTWWVNTLLIHEVDARKQEIDRNTPRWPSPDIPGTLSADEALAQALEEIRSERFLTALRRFPGFEKVELVRDADGRPVTGKILYLRESIHCLDKSGAHALTGEEVRGAGNASLEGVDQQNYASRVGLGCYYIDINAYLKSEPAQILETPYNPVYIPGEAVLTPNVPNLLVPGYAQSTDSTAWAAMRVIPNLSVCGDAAGVIAALCVSHSETPAQVLVNRVSTVQQAILNLGGRIDKGSNS